MIPGITASRAGGSGPPPAVDPYWDQVVLLVNAEDNPVIDNSSYAGSIVMSGNAARSTAQAKHGAASIALDGVSDYFSAPSRASLALGTSAFTFEMWFYARSLAGGTALNTLWNTYTGVTRGRFMFSVYGNTGLQFRESDTNVFTRLLPSGTISLNTWHHAAVTRGDANVVRLWLDGVQLGTDANLAYNMAGTESWYFGAQAPSFPNDGEFDGYFDDIRATVGTARYVSNFTPPGPLPLSGP